MRRVLVFFWKLVICRRRGRRKRGRIRDVRVNWYFFVMSFVVGYAVGEGYFGEFFSGRYCFGFRRGEGGVGGRGGGVERVMSILYCFIRNIRWVLWRFFGVLWL